MTAPNKKIEKRTRKTSGLEAAVTQTLARKLRRRIVTSPNASLFQSSSRPLLLDTWPIKAVVNYTAKRSWSDLGSQNIANTSHRGLVQDNSLHQPDPECTSRQWDKVEASGFQANTEVHYARHTVAPKVR